MQKENPLADAIGLASAYFRVKNMLDTQKTQKAEADQNIAASKTQQAESTARTAGDYAGIGRDPQGNPLPPITYTPLPTAPAKGQSPSDYYDNAFRIAVANAAAAHHAGRTADEDFWTKTAGNYSNQGLKYTNEQYTSGAKTDQANAHAGLYTQQTRALSHKFENDLALIAARGRSQEQVARIRAAYRSAGGGRYGNTAEQESRAMAAAMNEASRAGVDMQNSEAERDYYKMLDLHQVDPKDFPTQPQRPQLQTVPIYVPQPGGGGVLRLEFNPNTGGVNKSNAPAVAPAPKQSYPEGTHARIGGKPVVWHNGAWVPDKGTFAGAGATVGP